ncbi:hypothetical protein [Aeribacillus sp. FSL M8-0254]|uniref:hypothetical protein n=1 Tax=Aeribacillus sp. FSL M8-0254 TaxID=2954577 RepID=UPI0030F61974
MENEKQKRGPLFKTVEAVVNYHEKLNFVKNEDGTYSLTFKKLPALLFVSYDGRGTFDQLFIHGENKPEAQRITIESAVDDFTRYSIESLALLKTKEESK